MNIHIAKPSDTSWVETLRKTPHDIYHLPKYFDLEAKRSKTIGEAILIQKDDKIFFVPYLVRRCDDISFEDTNIPKIFDIVSPYGYPGILLSNAAKASPEFLGYAINEFKQILKSKGVCSAFLRMHPIINSGFSEILEANTLTAGTLTVSGQTVSVDLTLSESEIWNHTKSDRRNKINKCKRNGLTARIVPFDEYIQEFVDIYQETMSRVEANKSYLEFDYDYCCEMKNIFGESLYLCIVEFENKVASSGLYSEYNGIVEALFGGTRNDFFNLSPSSIETDFIRFWAKERGNKILHLGGGVGGTKNSLYEFKAGFSRLRHDFLTMRLIIDEEKYNYLVNQRVKALKINSEQLLNSNFFPAYRSA
jgi:FemAB family